MAVTKKHIVLSCVSLVSFVLPALERQRRGNRQFSTTGCGRDIIGGLEVNTG